MSEIFGIKGKLGFGGMRFPRKDGEIDLEALGEMVDIYLDHGFNYFDTAIGYHGGKSETSLKAALVDRHPRECYVLTDKLTYPYFKCEADIRPFFEKQLVACGVTYFDLYLMHAQDRNNYEKFKESRAYETAFALKAEGKVKHVGISFHDKAEILRQILTDYPQIEVVQLQFNYMDYNDPSVQSRLCLEVCREFGKPVLVMEPVKGGRLAGKLPDAAKEVFDGLGGGSYASYAIRFAAGFPEIVSVLSGMESPKMVLENATYMQNFKPLDEREQQAVEQVTAILRQGADIPCTGCRYCVEACPVRISIPDIIDAVNSMRACTSWNAQHYYNAFTEKGSKASDCMECDACTDICPQHLPVRELMSEAVHLFEKKD